MDRLTKRIIVIAACMLVALFSMATVSLRSGSASEVPQPEAKPSYLQTGGKQVGGTYLPVTTINGIPGSGGKDYPATNAGVSLGGSLSCPPATITGTIGKGSTDYPSTSGVQTGRVSQNAVNSTCAAPKTCPGIASAGVSFTFDSYQFVNDSGSAACVTFTFPTACGVNNAFHPVAYLGSFDPANPCTNYLGDIGHSINNGESGAFSVNVPANSIVVLVLHETGTQPGCEGYSFSVTGLPCHQAPCPPVTAINGTLGSGSPDFPATSGQQTGRLLNGLGNNTCGGSNPCSLNTPTGSRAFDAYTFNNPGATACVTVDFTFQGCASGALLQFSARIGSFDPANPCTNYVGDGGAGFGGGSHSFSFNVPAGQNFVVVVNENDPGSAVGCTYSLTISGLACQAAPCPPTTAINGALGSGSPDFPATSGQQTGRLLNGLGNNTCGSSNPCSLNTPTGSRAFDAYTFNNPGATACVTVDFTFQGCGGVVMLQFSARIGSFDPANPCANYVGDGGAGFAGGSHSFSFNVPAGQNFVVVVNENDPATATGCAYTLTISGITCGGGQLCTLNCPANLTKANDPNQCGAVVNFSAPTTSGNCGAVSCNPQSGSFFPRGTTTVTCTESNSSANCSFTVTVTDTQPPTITCPANIIRSNDPNQCGAFVTYPAPTVSDTCPGIGTPVCSPASGSFFAKGTTTVTCTVSDLPGNPASCAFTVTVNDTQPPSITCPANIIRSNDPNQCGAVVTYPAPTVSDNCPGVGTPVCSPASGSFFAKGTTTVTCTVSDSPGNPASCSFTITVNDTQPPSITCPANIIRSNDPNQCGAVVTYPAPTVSDNCPGVGTPVCSPASGSFFAKGTTTVTCTVSDSSGHPASCSFTITVNDTQPPQITCPANITAVTDQNVCPAPPCLVVNFPAPVVSDNCPGATVVCNPPSGSCFPTGVTTVTCTATDASGNIATCSFTVTTFDTALQDDSNPGSILLWNSITGQYRFCCNGITFTGVGKAIRQGCVYTLEHNPADRRVLGRVDKAVHAGSASIQAPPGTTRCTITDRNTLNDTLTSSCK